MFKTNPEEKYSLSLEIQAIFGGSSDFTKSSSVKMSYFAAIWAYNRNLDVSLWIFGVTSRDFTPVPIMVHTSNTRSNFGCGRGFQVQDLAFRTKTIPKLQQHRHVLRPRIVGSQTPQTPQTIRRYHTGHIQNQLNSHHLGKSNQNQFTVITDSLSVMSVITDKLSVITDKSAGTKLLIWVTQRSRTIRSVYVVILLKTGSTCEAQIAT